jgi:hypothetical protein
LGHWRTSQGHRASGDTANILPEYQPSVGRLREMLVDH